MSELTREQVEESMALTVGPQCDDSEAAVCRVLAHDAAQRATIQQQAERITELEAELARLKAAQP